MNTREDRNGEMTVMVRNHADRTRPIWHILTGDDAQRFKDLYRRHLRRLPCPRDRLGNFEWRREGVPLEQRETDMVLEHRGWKEGSAEFFEDEATYWERRLEEIKTNLANKGQEYINEANSRSK